MVANPSWDPNGSWTNVKDWGAPWTVLPPEWQAGWFAASGTSSPVNSEEDHGYNSANVSISGGLLNLTKTSTTGAIVVTNPANTPSATGFQFTPPVAYECRMNIPGSGTDIYYWPAFWSNGQNWPGTGEIDVMEGLGGTTAIHLHDAANPGGIGKDVPVSAGFHTFGAYWTGNQVEYFYDGVSVGAEPTDGFTGPHYLICQFTRNSSVPFNHGNQTVQVDWVRVWTPGGTGGGGGPTSGMTVTATASGSQAANGTALSVRVLTGAAAVQAGATVHNEALTVPQQTITPASSGSVIVGAVTSANPAQYTGQDANTTFYQNIGNAVENEAYLTFRATNPATAGTPVTVGAAGPPLGGGQMFGVLAEIQAAASQVIAEDATTPPAAFQDALTASTAAFTPPGGAVLVAIVAVNYNTSGTPAVTVNVTDSSGLTWTQLVGNSGAAGQDLCSVWVAGAGPVIAPPPITGPPPTTKQLIVSAAPSAGVDPVTGAAYPQGIQVGGAIAPQVAILPGTAGASVRFPVPAPVLANVPNMSAGALGAPLTFAALVVSGPAIAAAGDGDWTQLVMFSNDAAGSQARCEFRYIDPAGAVQVTAQYNGAKWLFSELVVIGDLLGEDPANPGSFEPWHPLGNYPSGATTRGQYRLTPMGELEVNINLTGTPSSGTNSFPNTLPAAYRPNVTKRLPAVQGAGTGWVTVSTAGVVSCTIAAGGTATFDCPGRVDLS